jgi:hypothetical protein
MTSWCHTMKHPDQRTEKNIQARDPLLKVQPRFHERSYATKTANVVKEIIAGPGPQEAASPAPADCPRC